MKKCIKCHQIKELSEFFLGSGGDGRSSSCKSCVSSYYKARRVSIRIALDLHCLWCKGSITLPNATKFCSRKHSDKYQWQKQKSNSAYPTYHRQKVKEYQQKMKEQGRCIICGKKAVTKFLCKAHHQAGLLRNKMRYKNANIRIASRIRDL